jgi:phage terminase large subunit-like protein
MLNRFEKAYCLALEALRRKEYLVAADHFEQAASQFANAKEFALLSETTRTLVAVQTELATLETDDSEIEIEEVFSNGQETDIR